MRFLNKSKPVLKTKLKRNQVNESKIARFLHKLKVLASQSIPDAESLYREEQNLHFRGPQLGPMGGGGSGDGLTVEDLRQLEKEKEADAEEKQILKESEELAAAEQKMKEDEKLAQERQKKKDADDAKFREDYPIQKTVDAVVNWEEQAVKDVGEVVEEAGKGLFGKDSVIYHPEKLIEEFNPIWNRWI